MSHIFDALQRAEAERTGNEPDALSLTSELLGMSESEAESAVAQPAHQAPIPAPPPAPTLPESFASPFDRLESLPVSLVPDSKLVSIIDKDSLAAEKFRFLGVRLRQLRQNRLLKKILITSTIPGEGKSMVAANLACTLARRKQQKTLLLDGDLRRPTLAHQLGLGRISGMSEVLQGSTDLMGSVYRLDALGLWILPAGCAPQNPLELMQSGKLTPLMDQLTTWFDWLVIDSPPVLPLADTSVWARLADGILLVTRQGTTEKQQLKRGLEVIESSKLLGAILNSSDNAAHNAYYGRYGTPSAARRAPVSPKATDDADQE